MLASNDGRGTRNALDGVETVQGRLVSLRPISREDYAPLFRWRSSFDTIHTLNFRRRVASFEEFVREIEATVANGIFMLIIDRKQSRPIGYAIAMNVNAWDRWAAVAIYVEPRYRYRGHGGEAGLLAVDWLFGVYPLDKIIAEVYEFAEPLLSMLRAMGFEEVGRMPDHYWFRDRRWDLFNMMLTRESWHRCRERFSDIISVQKSFDELESANEHAG